MPLVEKSDYLLAKGPDGKRVWIHKVTGEIRTSLPASDPAPLPVVHGDSGNRNSSPLPAVDGATGNLHSLLNATAVGSSPSEVAQSKLALGKAGSAILEKSDYVLAKGPDGKRVWIHKVTGEIRTSVPVSDTPAPSAPTPPPLPPSPGATQNLRDLLHGTVVGTSPCVDTSPSAEVGLLNGVGLNSHSSVPPPPPPILPAATSHLIPTMTSGPIGISPLALESCGAADSREGGLLSGVDLTLLSSKYLLDEDYELMAGNLSAADYNVSLQRHASREAENAAAAAAVAAAMTAQAGATAAMFGTAPVPMMGLGGLSTVVPDVALDVLGDVVPENEPPGEDDGVAGSTDLAMAQQLMQLNRFYLQQRVFDTQKMVASGEMPTRFKEGFRPMQLCKQFMKSASCVRGDTCSYAHTYEELHPMSPELPGAQSAKAVEALAEEEPQIDIPEPSLRMQRKRAMCQRLTRGGCLLGKKCPFAHSDAELGTVALAITDRVKTQLCKFHEQGKCVYGKYCVNAHGMNEIGKPKPDYLCPPAKQNKDGDDKDKDQKEKDRDRVSNK